MKRRTEFVSETLCPAGPETLIYSVFPCFSMRRGALIGAIIGFLAGLILQTIGTFSTGMAARSLSPESLHFLGISIGVTLFIAASCGIIGAFLGALLQDVLERR